MVAGCTSKNIQPVGYSSSKNVLHVDRLSGKLLWGIQQCAADASTDLPCCDEQGQPTQRRTFEPLGKNSPMRLSSSSAGVEGAKDMMSLSPASDARCFTMVAIFSYSAGIAHEDREHTPTMLS